MDYQTHAAGQIAAWLNSLTPKNQRVAVIERHKKTEAHVVLRNADVNTVMKQRGAILARRDRFRFPLLQIVSRSGKQCRSVSLWSERSEQPQKQSNESKQEPEMNAWIGGLVALVK